MNKLSQVLNIVFFVAIMVLFYLHFSDKDSSIAENTNTNDDTAINYDNNNDSSSLKIAYIELEKLLIDYQFSNDLNDNFLKRKESLQNQLQTKASEYEKKATKFQEKLKRGSFISQKSAENQQNDLLNQQQELQELQYSLENKLLEEQQNMNVQLYDSIINYLEEYNKIHKYQFILSKIEGGNLLLADSTFEITDEIIELLNKRYNISSK